MSDVGHNSNPYKVENPTLYASGYTLNLYCDHVNPNHRFKEFPHEFFSEWKTEAWKAALKSGWRIRIDGTATCPRCMKSLKKGESHDGKAVVMPVLETELPAPRMIACRKCGNKRRNIPVRHVENPWSHVPGLISP